jgi:hypothetical protein
MGIGGFPETASWRSVGAVDAATLKEAGVYASLVWSGGKGSAQGLESNVEEMGARALIPAPQSTIGSSR